MNGRPSLVSCCPMPVRGLLGGQTSTVVISTSTFNMQPGTYTTSLLLMSNAVNGQRFIIPWTLRVTSVIVFPLANVARLTPTASQAFDLVAVNMRSDIAFKVVFVGQCFNGTQDPVPTAAWLAPPSSATVVQVDALSTFNFRAVASYASVLQASGGAANRTGQFSTCFRLYAFDAAMAVLPQSGTSPSLQSTPWIAARIAHESHIFDLVFRCC